MNSKKLKRQLNYNPDNGLWTWLVTKGRKCKSGQVAGFLHRTGYIYITFEGRQYGSHQLAWFYMTGRWPKPAIDHRDGNPANNVWSNLRLASQSQNCQNMKKQARVLYKGVIFVPPRKYRARIYLGRNVHIGYFPTAELAHAAYIKAAKKHFGEFARAR